MKLGFFEVALTQLGASISYQFNTMTERPESMAIYSKANTIAKQSTGVAISNRGSKMVLMQINTIKNQPHAMA